SYAVTAFVVRPNWGRVLHDTIVPHVTIDHDFLLTLVAILGTTISPYLFFWQAAQEAEEEAHQPRPLHRALAVAAEDPRVGMVVSNLIMYFIVLTTGATLHATGQTHVETATQAAAALAPLAGKAAGWLFAFGIVGTGLLGVPV